MSVADRQEAVGWLGELEPRRQAALRFENEPRAQLDCLHCGTPSAAPFCCRGCETVYQLLQDAGLRDYYSFRDRSGGASAPIEGSGGDFSEFDSPAFGRLYCQERAESHLRSAELAISGLHCAACVWLVERLSRIVPQVVETRVDFARGRVRVSWDASSVPLSHVARALAGLGYVPSAPRGAAQERARQRELRSLMVRIGIAGACAGNVMLMAFALYSGESGAGGDGTMDSATRRFFELGSLLVSLPALAAGSLFFRGAWASLKTRTVHMDVLIALGIAVAFVWGAGGVLAGRGELYFDSITTLIFLLLIGRYLQRRHQLSAAEAAELLHSVTPSFALRVQSADGLAVIERMAAEDLHVGDVVEVKSGEIVPVDGKVMLGTSALDMSLLTGESEPVEVTVGSAVPAGSLNHGSTMQVLVGKVRGESRIAQLLGSIESALGQRTPLSSQADRVAGIFTLSILGLAAVTFAFWWFNGSERAVGHALSLLIVACPCALGMATPLALSVAARQAARLKILIFQAPVLERLATPSHLVLDKTGTLTEGRLSLVGWSGENLFQSVTRVAEEVSEHPVARALRPHGDGRGAEWERIRGQLRDLKEEMGSGIRGTFQGHPLVVGSERFVLAHATLSDEAAQWLQQGVPGASPLLVAWGGEVRAVGWLEDRLRPNVAEELAALRRLGHRLSLLSGDHPRVVDRVARQLTVQAEEGELFAAVRGGVGPEEKARFVAKLAGQGLTVVMVGDGVNDAAALARADVGVAVRGAAEASRLSADVYLAAAGVGDLVELMTGASRTLATIRRGMAFSLVYNAIGIALAMAGLLSPLWAAVLMPVSSLTVVSNAYRSRMFASKGFQS